MPLILSFLPARRCTIPLLALLACSNTAPAQQAVPVDPFADIPNVTFKYYDVSGTSERALAQSLAAHTIRDPNDGKAGFGLTYAAFKWHWWEKKAAACSVGDVSVEFHADVTLPRLVDEDRLTKSLRGRWDVFMAALRKHEAGHAHLALAHMGEIKSAISASACGHEDEAAKHALSSIGQAQRAYDTATAHGRLQGAVFP